MSTDEAARMSGRRELLKMSLERHIESAKRYRRRLREKNGSKKRIAQWGREITRYREMLAGLKSDKWETWVR